MSKFDSIRKWAMDVGIFEKGTAAGQYEKFVEECFEVEDALNGNGDLKEEIGDVIVTLTLVSEFHDFCIEDAIQCALDKIEKRKGTMIDGKFVKSNK